MFCDGRAYHCSAKHNRLADDAEKRAGLRDQGYLVWSLTHDDLDAFARALDGGSASELEAVDDTVRARTVTEARKAAKPGCATAEDLLVDPMSLLVAVVLRPQLDTWTPPAHALAYAHCTVGAPVTKIVEGGVPSLVVLGDRVGGADRHLMASCPWCGRAALAGAWWWWSAGPGTTSRSGWGWTTATAGSASSRRSAAWRDWLALGNVFQFLDPDRFHAHTSTTVEHASVSTVPDDPGRPCLEGHRRDLRGRSAQQGPGTRRGRDCPRRRRATNWTTGEIVVDLAWPEPRNRRVPGARRRDGGRLREHGWKIVEAEPDDIRDALADDDEEDRD